MSSDHSKPTRTPPNDSPDRTVVGNIFAASYYLMGNSYENVEAMLKVLEAGQSKKRSSSIGARNVETRHARSPAETLSTARQKESRSKPDGKIRERKAGSVPVGFRRSSIDLTHFSRENMSNMSKERSLNLLTKPKKPKVIRPVQNGPICRLKGPIRVNTTETIVYKDYGDSIIEEHIELIGSGPRDKLKTRYRLRPHVNTTNPQVPWRPDTKETVVVMDNYVRINRITRLKNPHRKENNNPGSSTTEPLKYQETRNFTCNGQGPKSAKSSSSTSVVGRKHCRPVLAARSDTALNAMPVFNLVGPLDIVAKQEVTCSDHNQYTIREQMELRAGNSKAEPVELLVPFVVTNHEALSDSKEGLPCKRNEKIFIGENVITIDRIVRLTPSDKTESYSVVRLRGYTSDKSLNTARDGSSESLLTAKSYGGSPPYYCIRGAVSPHEAYTARSLQEAHTVRSMQEAHTARSSGSIQPKDHDKIFRWLRRNEGKSTKDNMEDNSEISTAQPISEKSLRYLRYRRGMERVDDGDLSMQSGGSARSQALSRVRAQQSLSPRSESLLDITTAEQVSSKTSDMIKCSAMDYPVKGSSPCKHWLKDSRVDSPSQIVRKLDALTAELEESLQAAIRRGHIQGHSQGPSQPHRQAPSSSIKDLSTSSTTESDSNSFEEYTREYKNKNKKTKARSKQPKPSKTLAHPAQKTLAGPRRSSTPVLDKSLVAWRSGKKKRGVLCVKTPTPRSYRRDRRAMRGSVVRCDLLQLAPSMFDECIQTSKSPGCLTDRRMRENSARQVISDCPRKSFHSTEHDRRRAFESADDTLNSVESFSRPSSVVRTSSSQVGEHKRGSSSQDQSRKNSSKIGNPKEISITRPSNTTKRQDDDTNNIVIQTVDDRGITVDIDVNVRVKDGEGRALGSSKTSQIRSVIVNGRRFLADSDR